MKKEIILFFVIYTSSSFSTAAMTTDNSGTSSTATVIKQGKEIHYTGWLNQASFEKLKKLYDPSITTLVIDSRGGPVDTGMDLGEFIHKKGMDVHIKRHCFSSCANYVFPAGKIKYLDKDSQLGWHGSAFQIVSDALEKAPAADKAKLYRALTEERAREFSFYSSLGVEPMMPLYGLDRLDHEYKDCKGWTYSLKAMKQLNIHNIVLADKIWKPQDTFQNQCIFSIDSVTQ
ncbi:hypothetical protein F9K77_16350 [Ochrobactrum sp. LMG 5442]|nr:hypothetical protein F9K77_16350 [Ochrobactrum sp. LMG 5442]